MDQRLKDILAEAEDWPKQERDRLVAAATEIKAELRGKSGPSNQKTVFRTMRAAEPAPPRTVLEALMRAPKVPEFVAPKRGFRVRVRPPVKF